MVVLHETEWDSWHRSSQSHLSESLEYLFRDQMFREDDSPSDFIQRFLAKTVADMGFWATPD